MKAFVVIIAVAFAVATAMADPIHDAVRSNDIEQVRAILKETPTAVRARDADEATPLHYAAIVSAPEIAQLLLSNGADVNALNKYGDPPLMLSLGYDENPVTPLLIEQGANLMLPGSAGTTPLQHAAWHAFTNAVELLLKRGVTMDFFSAVVWGDTALVLRIIQTNASVVNSIRHDGATPLHWASARANGDMVNLLLKRGANLKIRTMSGASPLHWAAWWGNLETAGLLLSLQPALLDSPDVGKSTPLHSAAAAGRTAMVEFLLNKGAKINQRNSSAETALFLAVRGGHLETAETLVAKGAVVQDKNLNNETPLHLAVAAGHAELVQFLLSKKADPLQRNNKRQTSLDLASVELGWLILPHVRPEGESAVFYWALQHGAGEVVADLLQRKPALLRHHDQQYPPPLHVAARHGHVGIAELLIAKGANVNSADAAGQTPLHLAVAGGHKEMVELLLAKGANVNARGVKGVTPLRAAVDAKQVEIIQLLRQKGARE